jgi:hypothetical protein
MISVTLVGVLAGALAFASPRDARADAPNTATSASETDARAAAKREFSAGDAAYAHGDFAVAAAHFEAAYRYAPHPAALLNAAEAWEGAKNFARAATLYAKYLREAPADAPARSSATQSLKQVAAKVAELDLSATGLTDLAVDDRPTDVAVVYVEPGHHFVYARKGDRVVRSDVDVAAGSVTPVTLAAPAEIAPVPLPPPVTPIPVGPAGLEVPSSITKPPPEEAPRTKTQASHGLPPWVVYVGSGLTAIGIAATIVSGLDTEHFKNDVYDANMTTANLDAGLDRQKRTNILLIATVGAAATTGVFAIWLVDWHGKGNTPSVGLGLSPSSVALRSVF